MFPIGPVSKRTLLQGFADQLLGIEQRYGKQVPLFLMTSPATYQDTVDYLRQSNQLGLDPTQVHTFLQGTMPAVDSKTGRLLLASRDSLALSPDGHGGTVAALDNAGLLKLMQDRGIKHLFYAQVDNPLVRLCDPSLLGHHLMAGSDMTTQVIRKRYPAEKVGNVVLADGRVQIIEYSDLPDETAELRDSKGDLKLWAGNIAVHVFEVEFLVRSAKDSSSLPFHRAYKKVPHVDAEGQMRECDQPNATKFERFIFDLLPTAENAFVVEGLAAEVFAPVKNADGSQADTPTAARKQISDLHAGWLRAAGVETADGVRVEIDPRLASDRAEVVEAVAAGKLPPVGSVVASDKYFI
jgi:UDP-N-acetylglucosamine/UDP-N-acetylgalactosamine diphosphorylase